MLCGAVMPTGKQNIFALVKIFPGGSAAPHFHKGKYYPYGSMSSSSNERLTIKSQV